MKVSPNSRPSHGVSFRPWAEYVQELLVEHNLDIPNKHELSKFYSNDLSYEEVLHKMLFKNYQSIWIELNVRHPHGLFSIQFNTTEQAREFFEKFPEVREGFKR